MGTPPGIREPSGFLASRTAAPTITTDEGTRLPLSVSVGDHVLFSSYAGTSVKDAGSEYLILDESEILAIVDSKPFAKAKKPSKKKSK